MQRYGFYNPLQKEAGNDKRFLHSTDFIGTIEKGLSSDGERFAYSMVFGGSGVFYRWDESALWFSVVANVVATPFNDIGFDPYGASWQEEIRYAQSTDWGVFEIGFSHRCRHEIDNWDPGEMASTGPTKRVTLYAGPVFGYMSQEYRPIEVVRFSWGLDGQWVLAASDHREPDNEIGLLISDLKWKITPHIEAGLSIWQDGEVFFRGLTTLNYINGIEPLTRFESGLRLFGNSGRLDLYLVYEDMFEDYSSPIPTNNQILALGLRLSSDLYR